MNNANGQRWNNFEQEIFSFIQKFSALDYFQNEWNHIFLIIFFSNDENDETELYLFIFDYQIGVFLCLNKAYHISLNSSGICVSFCVQIKPHFWTKKTYHCKGQKKLSHLRQQQIWIGKGDWGNNKKSL